ncbi:hypothetical protein [Limnoglobus roseus]|uniref:Uncharacterized protein n=1 Tax=Limnoglobus roseus TaxID=2598579 RepID=A0A5C1AQF4_9BACT|nr:hypothetical protein [Limnoglobus roseus]QEL19088.1 hypothetical protein PX52LOC_06145 [Limnoglobus roseus]
MPKEIDLSAFIKELNAAKPGAFHTTYMKLPTGVTKNLAKLALDNGVSLSYQIRNSVEEYVAALTSGVCLKFDPPLLAHLDLAAENLGLDRPALVSLIVAEHITDYLTKSLGKLEQRKELESRIKAATKPAK